MKLDTLIKRVEKFNQELEECYKQTECVELYCVDTTIVGDTMYIAPFTITEEMFDGERLVTFAQEDGEEYHITQEMLDEEFEIQVDSLLWDMRYYRRMIKKTWRVWQSENPDAELENEDE
jgi:hypothetical protein